MTTYKVQKYIDKTGDFRDYGQMDIDDVLLTVKGYRKANDDEHKKVYNSLCPKHDENCGFYVRKGTENFFFVQLYLG